MKRSLNTMTLVIGFSLLLSAPGCFGSKDGGGGGGGGGTCSADADCKDNTQRCSGGACVDKCFKIACDAGQTCEPTTGQCSGGTPACTIDTDCNDATKRCAAGSCVDKCKDVICSKAGETCEPTTGACGGGTPNACSVDSDCNTPTDMGRVCTAGTCEGDLLGDCTGAVNCVSGLDCLTVPANGGATAEVCYPPCATSADCDSGSWCNKKAGDATVDHCEQNLCGPALGQYGYQQVAFGSACDGSATGAADGTCVGPFADFGTASQPLEAGLCISTGTIASGVSCPADGANGDVANLCESGICLPETQGAATGTCRAFCTIADGQSCPNDSTGTPTSCAIFGGLAGFCYTQNATPVAAGAACTPSQTESVCVEDSVCADPAGGSNNTCLTLCDKRASTGCPTGTTCQAASASDTNPLGICQ